jgi:hypothetical protein
MRSLFVLLIASAVFANYLPTTQNSARPTGQISAKQILDRNTAAIGGLESIRAARNLEASGTVGAPGINRIGYFHYFFKAPANDLFEFELVSHGQSTAGHRDGVPYIKMA